MVNNLLKKMRRNYILFIAQNLISSADILVSSGWPHLLR